MTTAERQERTLADPAILTRLEQLVQNTTRRVCFIPRGSVLFDYDDALAVARAAAWKAHVRYRPEMACAWDSWVILKIRAALLEAFRQFDYGARQNRAGIRAPQFIPLEGTLRARLHSATDDSDPAKVEDTVADPRDEVAEAEARMECEPVIRALRWLPPNEATVLRGYYLEGVTFKVIARRLERSESRVHQLHAQGLARARKMLSAGGCG